jgi:hypothetical protein
MWEKMKTWFRSFWASPAGDIIKDASAVLVQELGAVGAQLLLAQASSVVQILEPKNVPGTEKADIARSALKAYVERQGIPAATRLLNLVIEVAVVALSGKRP